MQIEKWMRRPVHTVKPLDSIQHARELMEAQRVNQLPVVAHGRLVGIITDRDLRDAFPSVFDTARQDRRHDQRLPDPTTIAVETVMTQQTLTISSKESVVAAARLMRNERVGALPVVDADHLVGIIARSDILDAFVQLSEGRGDEPVR